MSLAQPNRLLDVLTLFSSAGTLICCALPATLVALGAGSVMASLAVNVPGLIWISQHKLGVFVVAGVLLAAGGAAQWHARTLPCPIDPEAARACKSARLWSLRIYWFSMTLFGIGGFFAFVAPQLL